MKKIYNILFLVSFLVLLLLHSTYCHTPVSVYGDSNDKFYFVMPTGDKVYFGNTDIPFFEPTIELCRWDNECRLKLIPSYNNGSFSYNSANRSVYWQNANKNGESIRVFYDNDREVIEYDIILPKKPTSNIHTMAFEARGLDFYYQPSLADEYETGYSEMYQTDIIVNDTSITSINTGEILNYRPMDVVGSYSVYHSSKCGHVMGNKNYMAGKAFQWLKPLIYDSAGASCWGTLEVDTIHSIRTVTIPQQFIDDAVYPITIDDAFGYTSAGSSYYQPAADTAITWINGYAGSEGTGVSMSVYAEKPTGPNPEGNVQLAVYDTDSPANLVTNAYTPSIYIDNAAQWWTSNFATAPTFEAIDYCMVYNNDNGKPRLYYDSGNPDEHSVSQSFNTWPSTLSFSDSGNDYKHSIYCTYEPPPPDEVFEPTDFVVTEFGAFTTSINWTMGIDSTYTLLRASTSDYPDSTTDGELFYWGAGTTYNSTVFQRGVMYYASGWGVASDNETYSAEYTEFTIGTQTGGGISMELEHLFSLIPLMVLLIASIVFHGKMIVHLMLIAYCLILGYLSITGGWEALFWPFIVGGIATGILLMWHSATKGSWL